VALRYLAATRRSAVARGGRTSWRDTLVLLSLPPASAAAKHGGPPHGMRAAHPASVRIRRLALTGVVTCLTLAGLFVPSDSRAQPAPPEADEPPPLFEGTAQAALLTTSGNTSARALGLGSEIAWRPAPWNLSAKALFAQNETDDVLSARSTAAAFRADRFLSARTSLYGQYEFLRDLFAGIEQRSTVAGGIAYRLVERSGHLLTIDGGFGYEHEARVAAHAENEAIGTLGYKYGWEVSRTSKFADELRYVQPLGGSENIKIDHTISLTAAITSVFSIKLSSILRYSRDPVPGFESTDTITSAAFVWAVKTPAAAP
jgi:putative salt-induced outer membrane protein